MGVMRTMKTDPRINADHTGEPGSVRKDAELGPRAPWHRPRLRRSPVTLTAAGGGGVTDGGGSS